MFCKFSPIRRKKSVNSTNSFTKRLVSLLCATVLTTAAMLAAPQASAADETLPYVETFAKTAAAGDNVIFTSDDFMSHIVGDAELQGIVITALPLPDAGVLCVGDRALLVGEAVTAANLSALTFVPASDGDLSARFGFIPVFSSGAGVQTSVTVATLVEENHPPVAEDAQFETIKNIALTCEFPASDADGDELAFSIVTQPKKGTVAICEDAPGKFVYTPKENKTGTDSFTFIASDPSGAQSATAKVTIKIVKNAAKMTYADMDGDPAHYAALKLAADGVLIGRRIGSSYYFEPEAAMTRGEFVALAMTCLDIAPDLSGASAGFADDAETAAWLRPYVSAAAKDGIVNGKEKPDGSLVFGAADNVTRAEAAVILANAVGLVTTAPAPAAADIDAVPAWAENSVALASASGIMSLFDDGTIRPNAAVTRADAAEMLWSAVEVSEELGEQGLLETAFR